MEIEILREYQCTITGVDIGNNAILATVEDLKSPENKPEYDQAFMPVEFTQKALEVLKVGDTFYWTCFIEENEDVVRVVNCLSLEKIVETNVSETNAPTHADASKFN